MRRFALAVLLIGLAVLPVTEPLAQQENRFVGIWQATYTAPTGNPMFVELVLHPNGEFSQTSTGSNFLLWIAGVYSTDVSRLVLWIQNWEPKNYRPPAQELHSFRFPRRNVMILQTQGNQPITYQRRG